ncbi:MAG: aminomethyl-transferring glycine dehydrogenase [Oligoflexales bacterium]
MSVSNVDKNMDNFSSRHIGPRPKDVTAMVKELGFSSLEDLIKKTVPQNIQDFSGLNLKAPLSEYEAMQELSHMMQRNKVYRSLIGMGYYDNITPTVIQRNVLENPSWYTQYTPYQAEIAQGRLEALFNFQTLITDLTGLEIANASLLDEGTAAAEGMNMCLNSAKNKSNVFLVSQNCHPQTIAVVETRAKPLGITVEVADELATLEKHKPFAVLVQYPGTDGRVEDYSKFIEKAHEQGTLVIMATDLLSLCLLKSPGELGADVAVGTSQRFGVPLGYGGPHAGFFATKEEFKRKIPGRLVGLSKDRNGKPGYRLALATREQHIRRDKATSNICTAQVLLAIMSSMYAVYHGPEGLTKIALKTHGHAKDLAKGIQNLGLNVETAHFFDTITIRFDKDDAATKVLETAVSEKVNLRRLSANQVSVSLDEKTTDQEVSNLLNIFSKAKGSKAGTAAIVGIPQQLSRTSEFLKDETFQTYRSETELQRYIKRLENRDLSLTRSMIPLGSCTMKLNAASELMPITWNTINGIHPFVPLDQAAGYQQLFHDLETWLANITGFSGISLQPNSGAQGEYAGLLVVQKYHEHNGQGHRNVCLIPSSAHGTNPASAVLAGLKVIVVNCDDEGNIDVNDLKEKANKHKDNLSCLMVTYPSTHGVFEESITEICDIVHKSGGQVYMDGANLQAQIGVCKAGKFGPDVCHLNLHKTFCIPHGGGGPGMGPIGVKNHLKPFLPNHPVVKVGGEKGVGPVSAAPWGSSSILPITWMYIRMMGEEGLKDATRVSILSANYVAHRLKPYYPIVYKGRNDTVAHECIIDLKPIKKLANVDVDDVAKRLMDYGFHAPTVSWPVPNSMMIEPTESESKEELDRFCEAMISIRKEIAQIETGEVPQENNVLKNAPHTQQDLLSDNWDRPYTRMQAAFPAPWIHEGKFWPYVGRIDAAYGDRNLVCSCRDIATYQ